MTHPRFRHRAQAAVLSLILAVCGAIAGGPAQAAGAATDKSERIVAIGGAVTEILYALGREDAVVAVDSTSLYPKEARAKPNVGYMRQLSAEGVLGLHPSLVLAAEGSGPKETMALLAAAGVPMVLVPERHDGEGVVEKIRVVARAVSRAPQGECLAGRVARDLEALAGLRKELGRPVRVMFVLSFLNARPMVSGTGTAANGILALAGARNAVDSFQGYRQVSDEAVIAAAPDVVLVMQREGAVLTAAEVFAHPAFALTPAAKNNGFVSMEGLYLLGFGPRTPQAARDLAHALYPALKRSVPPAETAGAEDCR